MPCEYGDNTYLKMKFVKFFGKNYDDDTQAEGEIIEIQEHKWSWNHRIHLI